MLNNCENCGGKIEFEPKVKGNRCQSCGSVFPIEYQYSFDKNLLENAQAIQVKKPNIDGYSYKCSACGASMVMDRFHIQTKCPYCDNTEIVNEKLDDMLTINSIVPFSISQNDTFDLLKKKKKGFFVNKKMFTGFSKSDVKGTYINAFVFDINTKSIYKGKFEKSVRNKDGGYETKVVFAAGEIEKNYKNLTIEANSNLDQNELVKILPYDYAGAVAFKEDFMCGFILEYNDRMLKDGYDMAVKYIKEDLETEILNKHKCDKSLYLDLSTNYPHKSYNYCLLPMYFVNLKNKKKSHRVLVNGQTGKVSGMPINKWKVFWLVFGVFGIIAAIIIAIIFI